MIISKLFVVFLLIIISFGCAKAQVVNQSKSVEKKNISVEKIIDLSRFFKNTTGAIVIYDAKNDSYIRYNEKRCAA